MPVAVQAYHHQAITMSSPNQPRPQQLRRAVYIHVSDLTSAYNIDHGRLEEELARVKMGPQHQEEPQDAAARLGVPAELDTSSSQRRLQPPRAGYNLCVLVGSVNVVVDKNRVDGSRVRLAEVEVGDETGTVSLRARDNQIDVLKEVSERSGAVVLRNCTLELYQGKHIRLAVTKWGKLSIYPDKIASTPPPPSKINRDRNFSLIDLSVVASEMVAFSHADPYQHQSTEMENQSLSTANRSQQYNPAASAAQRRTGGRRQPAHKPAVHQSVPPTFADPAVRSYQGGLHSYGGMESQPFSGYPQHRQQENIPSPQQQMMLQQHYEMQQRQLHQQQMYHQHHHHHHPHHQQQQQQAAARPMPAPGHQPQMLGPGIRAGGSFDTTFSAGSADLVQPMGGGALRSAGGVGANPFAMHLREAPVPPAPSPALHLGAYPQHQQHASAMAARPPLDSAASGAPSPKMNPQAATFDPTGSRK